MVLGLSSYSFPWNIGVGDHTPPVPMRAHDILRIAGEHSIRRVQFGDNLPLHLMDPAEFEATVQTAGQLGVTIEIGMRGLTVENTTMYLELAKRAGSPFLRVVIDDQN